MLPAVSAGQPQVLDRLFGETQGTIVVDDGAARAVLINGKSLLPSGIVGVRGRFGVGAPVEFTDREGKVIGIGLVNYANTDILKIRGSNPTTSKSLWAISLTTKSFTATT